MIAPIPSAVSSVVTLAHKAVQAEGWSSLAEWGLDRRRRSPGLVARRQRVVYAMRHAKHQPSFPEIAQALGMPSHTTVITAYRREEKYRAIDCAAHPAPGY